MSHKKSALSTIVTVAIAILNYLIVFGGNIALSRLLGAENYGDYSAAFAVATLCYILAELGKDSLVVEKVPAYLSDGQFERARDFVKRNIYYVTFSGLVVGIIGAGSFSLYDFVTAHSNVHAVSIALLLVPLLATVHFISKVFLSSKNILSSMLPYKLQMPALLIVLAVIWGRFDDNVDEIEALALTALAWFSVFATYIWLLHRGFFHLSVKHLGRRTPNSIDTLWGGLPYLVTGLVYVAIQKTGVIMVEIFDQGEPAVGRFAAISQVSTVILTLLTATLAITLPKVSEALAKKSTGKLQRAFDFSFIAITPFAIIVGVILAKWGDTILGQFGTDFARAYEPMLILYLGYAVGAVLAIASIALQYAGYHQLVNTGFLVLLASNIILNLILIPGLGLEYGVTGAAIGMTVPQILVSLFFAYKAWTLLGASVIPIFRKQDQET